MDEIVTHVEMTAPGELRPGRPVDEVVLERIDSTPDLVRRLHVGIGTPYGWPSSVRSDEDWARWLARPLSQYWLIKHGTDSAGIADMQAQPDGDVEITTFGLLPEFVGKGLGGHALTLAVRRAWAVEPVGAEAVRRVWLHTSTKDHPTAIKNYLSRGFRPFREQVVRHPG
jgi:GNAT superfamily N-acetyltransferase